MLKDSHLMFWIRILGKKGILNSASNIHTLAWNNWGGGGGGTPNPNQLLVPVKYSDAGSC